MESAEEFKEKRNEDGYTAARKELHDFIEANPTEQECLVSWLNGTNANNLYPKSLLLLGPG
jgi:hypothetical protein